MHIAVPSEKLQHQEGQLVQEQGYGECTEDGITSAEEEGAGTSPPIQTRIPKMQYSPQ